MEDIKKVIVKPNPREKFSGVSAYKRSHETFSTQLSSKTKTYKTGLTKEQEAEYEEKLNLKPGTLSNTSNWWGEEVYFKLNKDKETEFIVSSPYDELVISVLYNRSNVAKPGEKITAAHDFIIFDAEAEAKKSSVIIDNELDAITRFGELSISERKDVLRLYGKRGIDSLSENLIKSELFKEVKANPTKFLNTLKDPSFETKSLIYKLVDKGVITKTINNQYMYGEDHIGSHINDVIAFINDPKNQKVKLSLKAKSKE